MSVETGSTAARWQWICGVNSSDIPLFDDFRWDKEHVLNNTCLIDVMTTSPHAFAIAVLGLALIAVLSCNRRRVTSKFHLRFPHHSLQWLLTLLAVLMQSGAITEGILTDATYRYGEQPHAPTQPHLYVTGACGLLAGVVCLVYSHSMERWRMPGMIWLLLMYWILAVAGQTVQLLSLLYQDEANVHVVRFDICVGLLIVYSLLLLSTLNIIRVKVCLWCWKGRQNHEVVNDLHTKDMFYMEKYSNLLSDKSYWWINWLLKLGYKRPIVIEDLGCMPDHHKAANIHQMFHKAFQREQENAKKKNRQPSLFRVYVKVHGQRVSFALLLKLIGDLLTFVGPVALTGIIIYAGKMSETPSQVLELPHLPHFKFVRLSEFFTNGYVLVVAVFLSAILRLFLFNLYDFWTVIEGFHLRSSLQTMIFEKSLRISTSTFSTGELTMGEINNHISTDAQNMGFFMNSGPNAVTLPIVLAVAVVLLYINIGASSLIGLSLFAILVPIQSAMGAAMARLARKVMKFSDSRLEYTNEMLQGMKLLKLYGWEHIFIKSIETVRSKEIAGYLKIMLAYIIVSASSFAAPILITLVSFGIYQPLTGESLTPAKAFSTLTLFSLLSEPMRMIPESLYMCTSCYISTKRLHKFFACTEVECESDLDGDLLEADSTDHDGEGVVGQHNSLEEELDMGDSSTPLLASSMSINPGYYGALHSYRDVMSGEDTGTQLPNHLAVKITNGNFKWEKESENLSLTDINVDIPKGKLTMVIGAVGSGKSSLLSAILGEMTTVTGTLQFSRASNSVAYANQKAWLLNDSLKNNILFGKHFHRHRYQSVIAACALQPDIDILLAGDETEIGEKGINLSGGQKQRVSVARAIYSHNDIVILDDPLSALDGHVGSQLFQEGILGILLKNNHTVVLVTHQLQYLAHADKILIMKDGKIDREGVLADIVEAEPQLYSQYQQSLQTAAEPDEEVAGPDSQTVHEERQELLRQMSHKSHQMIWHLSSEDSAADKGKLIEDEEMEQGSVSFKVYWFYLRSVRLPLIFFLSLAYLLHTVFTAATSFWLSKWSSDNTTNTAYYVGVYGALVGGGTVFTFVASISLVFATISTAKKIFLKLLHTIAHMPMRFFDITPVGRIMNRFSSDTEIVDVSLMFVMDSCVILLFEMLSAIIINVIVTPIFIVIVLPVVVVFFFIQKAFLATSRELQRINNVTRSPVYAFFSESLVGLSTIRAYRDQKRFFAKILKCVSDNNLAFLYLTVCNRWLGVRLDFMAALVVLISGMTTLIAASLSGLNASLVGLAISYALQISGMLNYLMRMLAELEMQMNSVERIKHYISLTPESNEGHEPTLDWPSRGEIDIMGVSARYDQDLDPVLNNIDVHISPGEKVGICGRTGSGKSSLALTLLRMIDMFQGQLMIDGVDIQSVPVSTLRRRLSIIPQDPVLFNGSIRMNLDPYETLTDDVLWNALEIAQLKVVISQLDDGLDSQVSEGGDNFSMGQRQLFCLARAFLRKSRILIMDEATASIDRETDKILQEVVATAFADRTVLTIAHRTATILESDTILVLDGGQIIEHDSPQKLLADGNTAFASLVSSTH